MRGTHDMNAHAQRLSSSIAREKCFANDLYLLSQKSYAVVLLATVIHQRRPYQLSSTVAHILNEIFFSLCQNARHI